MLIPQMTIHDKKKIAAIGLSALIAATSVGSIGSQVIPDELTKTTTETIAVPLHFAQESKFGIVTLSNVNSYLLVRSAPSLSANAIGKIKHGAMVQIIGEKDGFYQITLTDGRKPFVSKTYVKIVSSNFNSYNTYVKTSNPANRLNLRAQPNTTSKILAKLSYGTPITVLSVSGDWLFVDVNGVKGFVSKHYTSSSAPNSSPTASSASVTLNVPSFKQFDSRWASTKIGNKTIKQVGCVVTSAAMVHSYKSGSTVYPDAMRANLKFSNNDLYWSSLVPYGLTNVTSYNSKITNSIMSKIHAQLKAGNPVIIGGKKSNGTHYVVVTGYNGNSTSSFSPSNFTINDPNSSSRTTLAQFLASYPTIIKLVY